VYPTLYHFVLEAFGFKVEFLKFFNTFGFVVVIGFVVAATILASECARLEALGVMQPTAKGSWRHHAGEAGFVAAWSGFAGAKILYFLEHPSRVLNGSLNGFSMYGGLIFAGAMVMRYFRRNGITFWPAVDSAALGVFVAYAIGRLGCHLSGDGDWGVANNAARPGWIPNWMWAYDYPNNVVHLGSPIKSGTCFPGYCTRLQPGVFPTSVYEFVLVMLLVGVLWKMRTQLHTPGVLFGWFLIFDGVERIVIDQIRTNTAWVGPFTQVELIGTLLIIGGAAVAWSLPRRTVVPVSMS
jgi:phosphatidylglycerol---prolipoprotein diacylglyceryl transferase